jgi:AcrR family transcriptional regulator
MPRAGLSTETVTDAAAFIVDRDGIEALSMSRLAQDLGVRPPSLYNHVDGLEALVRRVALVALADLAEPCREAFMNRTGRDAVHAFARAYRRWALAHPGTYPLTQVARPGDPEWEAAARRLLDPLLAVLVGTSDDPDDSIHAARALRAAVHGFVTLELVGGFGLEVPTDASFSRMIDAVSTGISV